MDALPAEVRQELVMSGAMLDGHAVTTHRFRSALRPEPLIDTLRERWRAEGVAFVESRSGEWRLLSLRDETGIRTLQLRETASGTEGLISTWLRAAGIGRLDAPPRDGSPPKLADWLPDGTRVLRRLEHRDAGRDGATWVAVSPGTPADAAMRLRARAAAAGFVADPSVGLPAQRAAWYRGDSASGEALAFKRRGEEVVATVSGHVEGAAIVLHWGAAR